MTKKFIPIFALLTLLFSSTLFSETIVLKNGKTIEGKILEKTDKYIKVDTERIPVTYYLDEITSINESSSGSLPSESRITAISQISSQKPDSQVFIIPINPLAQFNFKSKADIYAIRKQAVSQLPQLAPQNYTPSGNVFGQIQDGKPWWGLLGICYYGNGEKSILGKSKESRFLSNPYILIGVEETNAYITNSAPLFPDGFYIPCPPS